MAYYYDQDGNKIPVDDHSTQEQKNMAAQQEAQNAAAAHGDPSTNGDAGGVTLPPDQYAQQQQAIRDQEGANGTGIVETLNPGPLSPAEVAKEAEVARNEKAAAADAAARKAAYDQAQSHFEYGGWAGGASEAASRYAKLGADAQGRQGETLALGSVNEDRNANAQARGDSMSMAQLLQARANGSMPSISGMRATQDIGRALADQSSIASSARGPGGLALASQNQANNSAAAIGNISNTAQINGAQEQLNNTMAAGQAFNSIRGGDQSLMGADAGISVAQANLNAQQRAENDRYQLGMTGAETDVQKAQLQAQGNQVGIAAGQTTAAAALAQNQNQYDSSRFDKYATTAAGAVAGAGGIVLGSVLGGGAGAAPSTPTGTTAGASQDSGYGAPGSTPGGVDTSNNDAPQAGTGGGFDPNAVPKADGGPIQAGHSYLVGERGPELIVPPRDGHVLTAEQTRGAMGGNRADAFLDGIHPLSYHYRDPAAEPRSEPTGGRYLGISAQDLEAVPEVGHQMVSEGPRGKQIESGPTLSAALAGMARLHERLKVVEGSGEHITSDMAAKKDVTAEGAWDQGHDATIENVGKVAAMSAPELRASPRPEAQAVRGIKADAWDEGHRAGMATLLRQQQGQSFDAAQASMAKMEHREPFDDSLSRFNPVEALRGRHPAAAPAQQRGAPVAHVAAPQGSFDSQVRDQFGTPPTPPPADPSLASLYRGGR